MRPENVDHLIAILTVEIGLIIAVSRLLGVVFRRFQQPQVIGEIVAGLLLGPSFFGWVAPGAAASLFPSDTFPFLQILAEYGIVFFMFLVGLELNLALLRHRGWAAAAISGASIVTPFALGAGLGVLLHRTFAGENIPLGLFAIFMGTAMSVTAFPVLARILIERDLLRSKVGVMTLTCAAVGDLVAWCLLSTVVALGRTHEISAGILTFARALLFVAVMAIIVRPLLTRLQALHESRATLSQNLLAVVLLLLVGSAATAQAIGLHAIFGAFLLGAAMPKNGRFARELADKLEDFAVVFLLPIYFAHTGLRTHIDLLNRPDLWMTAVAIIGVAIAGKFAGSTLVARLVGLTWREASALGVLLNTRGLMELVILNIALDLGLITPTLFTLMVLMAVVTTVITTPALAIIYPVERIRADVYAEEAPGPERTTVLIPVALSSSGPLLVDLARTIAAGESPRIYALHISRPAERGVLAAGLPPPEPDHCLAPAVARAAHHGLDLRPLTLTSRNPGDDICEVARTKGADLVIMGWHKPVFGRSVLGGTVDRVMRHSHAGVAVFIDKGLPPAIRRILLPYTGTPHDRWALQLAAAAAARARADITVLHVVRPGRERPHLEAEARAALDLSAPEPATAGQTRLLVVEATDPVAAVIVEAAGHDLTILGVGDEWQVAPHLFGLRTERIATECPSSLLIVRAPTGPR